MQFLRRRALAVPSSSLNTYHAQAYQEMKSCWIVVLWKLLEIQLLKITTVFRCHIVRLRSLKDSCQTCNRMLQFVSKFHQKSHFLCRKMWETIHLKFNYQKNYNDLEVDKEFMTYSKTFVLYSVLGNEHHFLSIKPSYSISYTVRETELFPLER